MMTMIGIKANDLELDVTFMRAKVQKNNGEWAQAHRAHCNRARSEHTSSLGARPDHFGTDRAHLSRGAIPAP